MERTACIALKTSLLLLPPPAGGSSSHPSLTKLDLHISELGKLAVSYLLNWQEGQNFMHLMENTLIIRESCGAKLGRRKF